jgi:hypothetical protein
MDISGNNSEIDPDTISAVAIDGATREIISGVMSLEERRQLGFRYAKNHPRYSENFHKPKPNPFKLGKPVRKYVSSSSESESDTSSESDSDSVDAVPVSKSKSSKRRIRLFDNSSKLSTSKSTNKEALSDKQKVLLKEICNISTIDQQLDAIGLSRNDFSKSNIMLILTVIDSIVSSNMLSKEENIKIKKLLDAIKKN